ncbi:hypothetical protein LWI28_002886 [Acer negundo]|uniref:Uncharacterized protein n=1 Tax=Acer negundo TaxID=4023 RepID=A0AAD5J965_ACENE|nr:hypothetical protein LWI28_002886 [Acer negundo]
MSRTLERYGFKEVLKNEILARMGDSVVEIQSQRVLIFMKRLILVVCLPQRLAVQGLTQPNSYQFPFKDVDTSYPHRKLTLFHTLPVDATAAITLAVEGEWLSETLDVLFGKRDVYPGAVVLKNRSAGDAFVWYSNLFSYLYQFATVWLDIDTMRWQPPLGRMGMKGCSEIPFPFPTSWTFILCSVVFQLPSSLDNQGYRSSVVTFTKGQPLGFIRFWPLFTLTHHMLVWKDAERVYGTTKLCDYAILGDGDRRREVWSHRRVVSESPSRSARVRLRLLPKMTIAAVSEPPIYCNQYPPSRTDVVSRQLFKQDRSPFHSLIRRSDSSPSGGITNTSGELAGLRNVALGLV